MNDLGSDAASLRGSVCEDGGRRVCRRMRLFLGAVVIRQSHVHVQVLDATRGGWSDRTHVVSQVFTTESLVRRSGPTRGVTAKRPPGGTRRTFEAPRGKRSKDNKKKTVRPRRARRGKERTHLLEHAPDDLEQGGAGLRRGHPRRTSLHHQTTNPRTTGARWDQIRDKSHKGGFEFERKS